MARKIKPFFRKGDTVKLTGKKLVEKYKKRRYKVAKVHKDELEVYKVGGLGLHMTMPKSVFVKAEGENDR